MAHPSGVVFRMTAREVLVLGTPLSLGNELFGLIQFRGQRVPVIRARNGSHAHARAG